MFGGIVQRIRVAFAKPKGSTSGTNGGGRSNINNSGTHGEVPDVVPVLHAVSITEVSKTNEAAQEAARKQKIAAELPMLEEHFVGMLASAAWQDRVAAVDGVGRQVRTRLHARKVVSDVAGQLELLRYMLQVIQFTLKDKLTPVFFATVDLVTLSVTNVLPPGAQDQKTLDSYADIGTQLVKWMSVDNQRVQEKSLQALTIMANEQRLGPGLVLTPVLAPITSPLPAIYTSRLMIILALLPVLGISEKTPQLSVSSVMDIAVPALSYSDAKVQKVAIAVVEELYRQAGGVVTSYTKNLPEETLVILDKKFAAIDKSKRAQDEDPDQLDEDPLWMLRANRKTSPREETKDAPMSVPATSNRGMNFRGAEPRRESTDAPDMTRRSPAGDAMRFGGGNTVNATTPTSYNPPRPEVSGGDTSNTLRSVPSYGNLSAKAGAGYRSTGPSPVPPAASNIRSTSGYLPTSTTGATGASGATGAAGGMSTTASPFGATSPQNSVQASPAYSGATVRTTSGFLPMPQASTMASPAGASSVSSAAGAGAASGPGAASRRTRLAGAGAATLSHTTSVSSMNTASPAQPLNGGGMGGGRGGGPTSTRNVPSSTAGTSSFLPSIGGPATRAYVDDEDAMDEILAGR